MPEDDYVNTWHFGGPPTPVAAGQAFIALNTFYTVGVGTGLPVAKRLSPTIEDSKAVEMRAYNTSVKPSGPPFASSFFILPDLDAGQFPLPEEVAIVLSGHSTPLSNQAGVTRSRVFIGPLNTSVVDSRPDGHTKIDNATLDILANAAIRLRDDATLAASSNRWSTRSAPLIGPPSFAPVLAGFINNAFDTQRRRGVKANDRRLFVAA